MKIMGKTAIVTGGASGLGEATVRALVQEGAKVAIWDMNNEKGAALAEELGEATYFRQINITDEKAVQDGIDEVISRFGGLHIVGNIAGISISKSMIGRDGLLPLDHFTKHIDVNLTATYNILQHAAWAMGKQEAVNEDGERGVIINTSSTASYEGQRGQVSYSASKGGVNALCLPAARELARNGIRVTAIVPGMFETPIYGNNTALVEDLMKDTVFPKRFGKPAEFASFFLEIVRNPMLNGTAYRLDGAVRF